MWIAALVVAAFEVQAVGTCWATTRLAAARTGRSRGAHQLERGLHLFSSETLASGGFTSCLFPALRLVCVLLARSAAHLVTPRP